MNAKEPPTQTQLVLINPSTGESASLGSWPAVMSDARGSDWLEVFHDPFPRIDVRRMHISKLSNRADR